MRLCAIVECLDFFVWRKIFFGCNINVALRIYACPTMSLSSAFIHLAASKTHWTFFSSNESIGIVWVEHNSLLHLVFAMSNIVLNYSFMRRPIRTRIACFQFAIQRPSLWVSGWRSVEVENYVFSVSHWYFGPSSRRIVRQMNRQYAWTSVVDWNGKLITFGRRNSNLSWTNPSL